MPSTDIAQSKPLVTLSLQVEEDAVGGGAAAFWEGDSGNGWEDTAAYPASQVFDAVAGVFLRDLEATPGNRRYVSIGCGGLFRLTAGGSIAFGHYVKPDPSVPGRVITAPDLDSPALGRALSDALDGERVLVLVPEVYGVLRTPVDAPE